MTDRHGEGVLCDVPWCGAPATHERNPCGLFDIHLGDERISRPRPAATRSGRRESRRICRTGGTLEHAQRIAGHASPKTTKLYDQRADTISLDEIERIVI